jgi:hypothetical protein
VAPLAVLGVEARHGGDELVERLGSLDDVLIAPEPLLARAVERGEEQPVEAAEVVEDQRLVEAARAGDRARGGAGEPVVSERLERGLDDLPSCRLAA